MSHRPIDRSDDLRRLRAEGYSLRVSSGRLVVDDVPFVDASGAVQENGALVMALNLAGDVTAAPDDHTAYFVGGVPHDRSGRALDAIINNKSAQDLGGGLVAACYLSAKPKLTGAYVDYHQKVNVYVAAIAGPAAAVDPSVSPRRFRPVRSDDDASPFEYVDTASARAGTDGLNEVFRGERVAIVGLGGTGEYILDLVAKTHVAEIHVFDADRFHTHNAFRAPGAATLAELEEAPLKVDYFQDRYAALRSGIVAHPYRVVAGNVDELHDMSFVFVAVDDPEAKEPIMSALLDWGVPFIDVGMGIELVDGKLTGLVRTTTATAACNDHAKRRIAHEALAPGAGDDYGTNIQIAELNALNATLAVIRWKKLRGFYADVGAEHHSVFSISTNHIVNDDIAATGSSDAGE